MTEPDARDLNAARAIEPDFERCRTCGADAETHCSGTPCSDGAARTVEAAMPTSEPTAATSLARNDRRGRAPSALPEIPWDQPVLITISTHDL
jgi:hypothetical protein